jgi:lipoprotein-anchoring transpeptidase ErfK/SrfK
VPRLRVLSIIVCAFHAVLLAPAVANAQSLFSFFWEGGSREIVRFDSRHAPGQIIVSFGDRRLYWIQRRGAAISYPVAVPRERSRWQGVTRVSDKRRNPGWTPTASMRRENPRLPAHVPGGHPMNPLGVRALYLGSTMYRIHGTDDPWTIGTAASKGCIRMYNTDVLDLYPRVPVGTRVTVTWRRFRR